MVMNQVDKMKLVYVLLLSPLENDPPPIISVVIRIKPEYGLGR
jgi:hypothetical protein